MNRLLALAFGLSTLAMTGTAQADHWRFGGGGRVRVHAGVGVSVGGGTSVTYSRPAYYPRSSWSVGGSIYVGSYPRYRYYRPYYYYSPVPSYYGYYSTTYYPVAPEPCGTCATTTTTVVEPSRPELPKFGIGLFAGGVSVEDRNESSDFGALARFRLTPGLILEGEIGKQTYQESQRTDRRLGASLLYEIGAYNKLAPYVLAGMGVQQAEVDGDFTTTQHFGELGIGLRWALTPNFHLTFDIRAGSRASDSDNSQTAVDGTVARSIAPPTPDSNESEEYTRARLAAILYF